jgi:serine/threonine-protein kinase
VIAEPRADQGDALIGTLLAGRYRILQKLGEGAMGSVYLGEHVRMGRRDAIKVLRPALHGDAEAVARFERGARNASSIHHPNVCTVYDFGDAEGGRRFLSMEYVPGEQLQDLMKREGGLPAARAVAIAAQVANALQAAHDRGIVHRDLKPANVMVSPARGGGDAVKVVDFDIAKGSAEGAAADVTRLGYVIGTPEYMSPEQLLGLPLDGRSDVYSLALVLFEMLAGQLPGGALDTQQRVQQRLAGTPPPLEEGFVSSGTPPALRLAIAHALHARAEDRVPSAADFARAITAALAEPVIPAPSPASGPRYTRGGLPPTRAAAERSGSQRAEDPAPRPISVFRPPIPRPAGIALVLMVAAGAVWTFSRPPDPPAPENGAASAGPPAATASAPSATNDVTLPGTTTSPRADPDPPGTPLSTAGGAGDPTGPATGRAGDGAASSTPNAAPPVGAPETEEPSAPAGDVAAVLAGLEDSVGPPYPAASELRRVRGAAREVWDQGARVELGARARAAFVLAHAELGLGEVEECVRWAERAVALRPGGARQVLLEECRRVRG